MNLPPITIHLSGEVRLAGDYNRDGVVGAADFIVWRKALGQAGNDLAADGNGNNEIDPGDYNIWRTNFGRMAEGGAGTSSHGAVPEPASALLLLIGATIRNWRLRKSRKYRKLNRA